MNLPEIIRTIRWMIHDTWRQSVATKLFSFMIGVTAVCTLICLSVSVKGDSQKSWSSDELPAVLPKADVAKNAGADQAERDGVRVISGEITLGFGAMTVPIDRSREESVRMMQLWLVAFVADTVGVLLALLWTAGFLPTFLEPQSATVLLAKPAARWSILLGKYLGVLGFVAFHATLFIGCIWLALGMRTGVWFGAFWLAVPLLILNFGIFYSVSTFIAVATRSTIAAIFGTLLFWLLCWAVNYTHLRLIAYPMEQLSASGLFFMDIVYWALPKPMDLGSIFYNTMSADGVAAPIDEIKRAQDKGRFFPEWSVISSCLFATATLGFAIYEFETLDY